MLMGFKSSHVHMKEKEIVGCCRLLYGHLIRLQVDLFPSSNWTICPLKLQKLYEDVLGHPRSQGSKNEGHKTLAIKQNQCKVKTMCLGFINPV